MTLGRPGRLGRPEAERVGLYYSGAAANRPLYRTATKADAGGRLRNTLVSVDIF